MIAINNNYIFFGFHGLQFVKHGEVFPEILVCRGLGVRNVPKQIESKSVLENPGNFSG